MIHSGPPVLDKLRQTSHHDRFAAGIQEIAHIHRAFATSPREVQNKTNSGETKEIDCRAVIYLTRIRFVGSRDCAIRIDMGSLSTRRFRTHTHTWSQGVVCKELLYVRRQLARHSECGPLLLLGCRVLQITILGRAIFSYG